MVPAAALFRVGRLGTPGHPWTKVPPASFWQHVDGVIVLPVIGDNGEAFNCTFLDFGGDFQHTFKFLLGLKEYSLGLLSAYFTKVPDQPRFSIPGVEILSRSTVDHELIDPQEVDPKLVKCIKDVRQTGSILDFRRKVHQHAKAQLMYRNDESQEDIESDESDDKQEGEENQEGIESNEADEKKEAEVESEVDDEEKTENVVDAEKEEEQDSEKEEEQDSEKHDSEKEEEQDSEEEEEEVGDDSNEYPPEVLAELEVRWQKLKDDLL